jgi:Uma2 family endonuclease
MSMRVGSQPKGAYFYPDLVAVRGDIKTEGDDTLINPFAIIEVLSPSTEASIAAPNSATTR